jgi:hypothetical protein
VNGHQPLRPSWDCAACGRPWPCQPAREALTRQYRGRGTWLTMYMLAHMTMAAADMPTAAYAELSERFINWTWEVG